jgi:hypothetical protein
MLDGMLAGYRDALETLQNSFGGPDKPFLTVIA